MSTSVRIALLQNIHTSGKHIMQSSLFREPTEVVRLDYLGANDYFITDRGYVYNRKDNNTNRAGILTRGYLPLTQIDVSIPYPWVYLPTSYGKLWFPINQLLGWSFKANGFVHPDIYVTEDRKYFNNHYSEYKPIVEYPKKGFFRTFMLALYKDYANAI